MEPAVFNKIRKIVYDQSGIRIQDGKMSMVASRLAKRLRALGLADERAYVKHLETKLEEEIVSLLDAVSTNVTHFFRESHHFDRTRDEFNGWLEEGQTRFRFWSAASSTGEEPYSLAMTLSEVMRKSGRKPDVKILATDISTRVLDHCKNGCYEANKVSDIPSAFLKQYFKSRKNKVGEVYEVSPTLRNLVRFTRLNLSQPPFPMKGPLDIIFCRNVMIYFDNTVRSRLLNEFHRLLRPGGLLMVGHAESLTGLDTGFERSGASVYKKADK